MTGEEKRKDCEAHVKLHHTLVLISQGADEELMREIKEQREVYRDVLRHVLGVLESRGVTPAKNPRGV